jgi:hypothetical protein
MPPGNYRVDIDGLPAKGTHIPRADVAHFMLLGVRRVRTQSAVNRVLKAGGNAGRSRGALTAPNGRLRPRVVAVRYWPTRDQKCSLSARTMPFLEVRPFSSIERANRRRLGNIFMDDNVLYHT